MPAATRRAAEPGLRDKSRTRGIKIRSILVGRKSAAMIMMMMVLVVLEQNVEGATLLARSSRADLRLRAARRPTDRRLD